MTTIEIWLLVLAGVAATIAYWLGRIDGYWKRAEEDRDADLDAIRALGRDGG